MRRIKLDPYKCPVCNGTGLVSVPPGVAGDQPHFNCSTDCGPWPCRVCQGQGIIWREEAYDIAQSD